MKFSKMMCPALFVDFIIYKFYKTSKSFINPYYFAFCSTATAQATVIPTIGLLPAPIKPIFSTHIEAVNKKPF